MQNKKFRFFFHPRMYPGSPLEVQYINWFGFVTIPFLALVAFTLITLTMMWMKAEK